MNISASLDNSTSSLGLFQTTAAELFRCPVQPTGYVIATSVSLALITLATMVGNLLVIASVVIERNLRTVANCLVISLAVTDLFVALLVMPLSAINQVEGCWIFGPLACNLWIFFDVLCCTSSIYHLVAIAFDRLWAVSSSDYIHNRPSSRILLMVSLSWCTSAVICAPPLIGITAPHGAGLARTGKCEISQDFAYTVFSTVGAFYLPLVTIVAVYSQVYRQARARILKKHFKNREQEERIPTRRFSTGGAHPRASDERSIIIRMTRLTGGSSSDVAAMDTGLSSLELRSSRSVAVMTSSSYNEVMTTTTSLAPLQSPVCRSTRSAAVAAESTLTLCVTPSESSADLVEGAMRSRSRSTSSGAVDRRTSGGRGLSPGSREKTFRRRLEQKRERKAARTLTVVTGTFVVCWLPFFVVAFLRPVCSQRCQFPHLLTSAILWLGYVNSLLNPMIYTLFNTDFRTAFRKILLGGCGR